MNLPPPKPDPRAQRPDNRTPLDNRAFSSEQQRKAVMAKLRGRSNYADKVNPGGEVEKAIRARVESGSAMTDEERQAADDAITAAQATETSASDTDYDKKYKASIVEVRGSVNYKKIKAEKGHDAAEAYAKGNAFADAHGEALGSAETQQPSALARAAAVKQLGAIMGAKLAAWVPTVGMAAAASAIAQYRADNVLSPGQDKALAMVEQLLGYGAAMSGLATGKKQIGGYISSTGAGQKAKAIAKAIGNWMARGGQKVSGALGPKVMKPLEKAWNGYKFTSEATGVSLNDLAKIPGVAPKLQRAEQLRQAALAAQRAADTARAAGNAVQEAAATARAASLAARAEKFTNSALDTLLKSGIVAAGFGAKLGYEEAKIARLEKEATAELDAGKTWTADTPDPRGLAATLGVAALGANGNALEKQFRLDTYPEQEAAYRAKWRQIEKAEAAGTITKQEADTARAVLHEDRPWKAAGNSIWTFAPASSAALAFMAREIADGVRRRDTGDVVSVADADTITYTGADGKKTTVRALDFNAPEIPHPGQAAGVTDAAKAKIKREGELLGPEAAARAKELLAGKTVRVVTDSHERAAGLDKYGRKLGYIEAIPKGLGWLAKTPVVGNLVPGTDIGQQLISEGLGDSRYRELSGKVDRGLDYDRTRALAEAAGVGVWSPDGRKALPWVGTAKDQEDPEANWPLWRKAMQPGGIGLMATGQGGVLSAMGAGPGTALATTWNAALALGGAFEYNEKAKEAKKRPIKAQMPKGVKTQKQREADELHALIKARQ